MNFATVIATFNGQIDPEPVERIVEWANGTLGYERAVFDSTGQRIWQRMIFTSEAKLVADGIVFGLDEPVRQGLVMSRAIDTRLLARSRSMSHRFPPKSEKSRLTARFGDYRISLVPVTVNFQGDPLQWASPFCADASLLKTPESAGILKRHQTRRWGEIWLPANESEQLHALLGWKLLLSSYDGLLPDGNSWALRHEKSTDKLATLEEV